MASVFVPVAYLVALVGALFIFSRVYRKRAAQKQFEPWFPSHPERDAYITLLQLDPPAHDTLLKAALLRRACADVQRIIRLRDDKTALQALLQKGSIGDDLWTTFQVAEKELEAEIMEVMNEANSFREGWGQIVFQTASEILQNEKLKDHVLNINAKKAEADIKFGKRQATLQVKGPTSINSTPSANGDTALPSTPEPNGATPLTDTASIQSPSKKAKKRK